MQFIRVSRSTPCPVCGKPDWCVVNPDEGTVKCMRVPSNRECVDNGGGWIHKNWEARGELDGYKPAPPKIVNWMALAKKCMRDADVSVAAAVLGVSVIALARLRIGWLAQPKADTFPMLSWETGKPIGIRIRCRDSGKKWAIEGSKNGLFIPKGFDPRKPYGICEGPTDVAACLDLGFECIGRASCACNIDDITALVQKWHPKKLLIFADKDEAGAIGADRLMLSILESPYCPRMTRVTPPDGVNDMRQWKLAGATMKDVIAVIKHNNQEPKWQENEAGTRGAAANVSCASG